jgi:hypothetical protein
VQPRSNKKLSVESGLNRTLEHNTTQHNSRNAPPGGILKSKNQAKTTARSQKLNQTNNILQLADCRGRSVQPIIRSMDMA